MSTEHCTFDQLDSKSRTETFARHLQNRLRSLSVERDGPEDPSWNCDQLSSSSDNDIYYDLDSYPGSPAEEATEDFDGFLALKRDGLYNTSTSGNFINEESTSNGTYSVNSENDFNGFCLNGGCIEHCNRIDCQNSTSESEIFRDDPYSNGDEHFISSPDSGISGSITKENGLEEGLCSCVNLDKNKKTDFNCNSTVDLSSSSSLNGEPSVSKTESKEIVPLSNHLDQEERKNSQDLTEDALCRLVDAVFPDSRSNSLEKNESKESDDEDVDETIEKRRAKFRRSSSLKSGKTPPGTPGQKKIVRFADVLGLDLADVRTFLDEVPKVPRSAFNDLQGFELSSSPVTSSLESSYLQYRRPINTLVALFTQPSSRLDFLDRVRDNCVCLENAVVSDMALFAITGVVRVKNIDFNKSVHVRYSIDNWKTFADLQARYVPSSCDGFSDKFTFLLYAHMLSVGQRIEFAVRYHARGSQYWDSNYGLNYVFQCVQDNSRYATSSPFVPVNSPTNVNIDPSWDSSSFY